MADKEFRRLGREELIEIIYQLQINEQKLQAELDAAREELQARNLKISEAGSIAEAMAGLSGIFETAQQTADWYLEAVKNLKAETELQCANLIKEARAEAESIRNHAERS